MKKFRIGILHHELEYYETQCESVEQVQQLLDSDEFVFDVSPIISVFADNGKMTIEEVL